MPWSEVAGLNVRVFSHPLFKVDLPAFLSLGGDTIGYISWWPFLLSFPLEGVPFIQGLMQSAFFQETSLALFHRKCSFAPSFWWHHMYSSQPLPVRVVTSGSVLAALQGYVRSWMVHTKGHFLVHFLDGESQHFCGCDCGPEKINDWKWSSSRLGAVIWILGAPCTL